MAELLLSFLAKFLVFLFFAGIVGSAVVVVVTFIEDGELLFEKDEAPIRDPDHDADFPHATAAQVGD